MIQKALAVKADAIGMSGLLVKSTVIMKENLQVMKSRNIQIPILLGGAALTKNSVDEVCKPILDAPVSYCADAFESLHAMELIKSGSLENNQLEQSKTAQNEIITKRSLNNKNEKTNISRDITIPDPPFLGERIVEEIDLDNVFANLNETVLFRGRWGYRRGRMKKEGYESLLETEVRTAFEKLKHRCKDEQLLEPKLVYSYYQCNSDSDQLFIDHIVMKNDSDLLFPDRRNHRTNALRISSCLSI
ncbi:MAG: hypothetical protein JSW07_12445 [bacterium]|nr:MAG: hypothetical protein JSW07_12445 [bacterium]